MNDLQRRAFLTGGMGLLAAGAIASCSRGGGGGNGGGGGEGATEALRVSWYGGEPVTDGMTAALEAFGSDNADVTVATEFAPFDDYWDRLATQTAGGESPDVFRMSMSFFQEYADRGALLDVGELVSSGAIDAGALDADVAASGVVGDGTFGVGQSSIAHAIFVDPAQLEAVGLAAPQIGWTWEEFETLATGYATEAGDGYYGCNDGGGSLQAFDIFGRQHSGDMFAEDGTFALGVDVVEEWFAMWNRLREAGVVPPGDLTAETAGFENALLVKGTCAMQLGWVQQVTFYQPLTESPLEVVSVPSLTSGDLSGLFVKALDFWCVSAKVANPETAAAAIDFLLNDSRAIDAIGLTLGVPPSQAARDQLAADPESAAGRAIAYVESIADQVGPPSPAWPVGYSAVLDAFSRANEQVAFGELDPAAAAAGLVADAEAAVGG